MFRAKRPIVRVEISQKALEAIFDECDGFDVDETGGRVLGTYKSKGHKYDIQVSGIIGPGPKAKRSATSFFQDGEYQAEIFRKIEEAHSDIEHLGNWHTHHVNGYPTLSSGDKATYQRIVNHQLHNTDFFYAILVVEKLHTHKRYRIKHYFLRRNDPEIYEIPDQHVRVTDKSIVWPLETERKSAVVVEREDARPEANPERAKDQLFFSEFYPEFKALFSKSLGAFYWKGNLDLVDGTVVETVLIEADDNGRTVYSPASSGLSHFKGKTFKSARKAVLEIEKELNREIFRNKR